MPVVCVNILSFAIKKKLVSLCSVCAFGFCFSNSVFNSWPRELDFVNKQKQHNDKKTKRLQSY